MRSCSDASSAPALVQRTSEPCERVVSCVVCGSQFRYLQPGPGRLRRFCSKDCRRARLTQMGREYRQDGRYAERRSCRSCGTSFVAQRRFGAGIVGRAWAEWCSRRCQGSSRRLYASPRMAAAAYSARRRALLRGLPAETFDHAEIFERDAWRCGLCGKKVDRRRRRPHPKSPSLDHIVPISKGGAHTRVNVQCSHFLCNSRKTSMIRGQMRLFG